MESRTTIYKCMICGKPLDNIDIVEEKAVSILFVNDDGYRIRREYQCCFSCLAAVKGFIQDRCNDFRRN